MNLASTDTYLTWGRNIGLPPYAVIPLYVGADLEAAKAARVEGYIHYCIETWRDGVKVDMLETFGDCPEYVPTVDWEKLAKPASN